MALVWQHLNLRIEPALKEQLEALQHAWLARTGERKSFNALAVELLELGIAAYLARLADPQPLRQPWRLEVHE